MRWFILLMIGLGASGCMTSEEPMEPVVDVDASLEFLEPGLRPEVLLFPEYLMMEEFELHQHGRIPETPLVGGGMKTEVSLSVVRGRFNDVLADNGWQLEKTEIGRQSFRLIASRGAEQVEIRAVQGGGPTQVFILYTPDPATEATDL